MHDTRFKLARRDRQGHAAACACLLVLVAAAGIGTWAQLGVASTVTIAGSVDADSHQTPRLASASAAAIVPHQLPRLLQTASRLGDKFLPEFLMTTPRDADSLVRTAKWLTRLDDLGPGEVHAPLQALLDAVDNDPAVGRPGQALARVYALRQLNSRLKVVDHLNRNPHIRDVDVPSPIIVLGLPRSGTTVLYNLLAQHPGSRPLLGWESYATLPRFGGDRVRRGMYRGFAKTAESVIPDLPAVHKLDPIGPDEGIELMERTFHSMTTGVLHPDFVEYVRTAPTEQVNEAWKLYYQQLQLLNDQHTNDFWVLKSPGFLTAMDALEQSMPNARYVLIYRDLEQSIPSSMSLFTAGSTPLRRPGQLMDVSRLQDTLPDLMLSARDRLLARGNTVEVLYPDLLEDPARTVQRIYRELGEPVPDDMSLRVSSYLEQRPQHKHGKHSYSAQDYGIDETKLRAQAETFADAVGLPRP